MRVNSPATIARGRALLGLFGSWDAMREASKRNEDGVYVVPATSPEKKA